MKHKHTFREVNDIIVLELSGKIMGGTEDTTLVNQIYEFADQNKTKVVIDFSEVEWMNSRGLGICICGATTLRNRGGDLRLARPSEKVAMLLNRTRMFTVFEVFDTVEEAVDSFK
ncbi:MAG: STAS domain-containing protein [Candidatus Zixiibacteriota bacterium]|nr:MAG: STAS domain-containing protein [candidate division Zixibacteria bacterium]